MARQFSFADAKKLINTHKALWRQLDDIQDARDECRRAIQDAAERYVTEAVLKLMEDVPIEEVNRDKRGIRVKALRECGYSTYADVLTASVSQLAAVRGISVDTAHYVKRIVNDAADIARHTTRLHLSADNRSRETTRLIVAISRYRKSRRLANAGADLDNEFYADISSAIEDVQRPAGFFKWMFASKQDKQKAIDAYDFLQRTLDGEYGNAVKSLSHRKRDFDQNDSADEAWESFQKNPIRYTTILENIAPGVLDNRDTVYGLPEDLAREVQDECFFPDGLLCDLRRYQEWGVKYILHQGRVLLGDEMGLGKTVQAIATMVSLKNTGATHFVVLCPASVIINWYREIRKFSKLRAVKVHGAGRGLALQDWIKTGGVAVTTYETTAYFELPEDFTYALLVVDEAHYIKNPKARRSMNTRKLSAYAERLLFMTGTALENNVDEMVNLIEILQPSIAHQIRGMKMLTSAPQFRERIAPVYYRRKREDVLSELPDLLENEEWCQLGAEEMQEYENAVLSKSYHDARRVSWSVDDLRNSSKAMRMLEIIEEAKSENRKIIVFSFYLDTIRKISDLLGNRCSEPLHGSISPIRRQEILDEFEKAPTGQVLAAQIVAGGTGLNIQSASVVILCEPQLKPSIENQAIARAYRMGQARNVLVYRLLCENTIDEKISAMLARKQAVFNAFADQSVAAQNVEVDSKSFGDLIQEEIDRINKKRKQGDE